jgi:hypothetical protein
MFGLNLQANAAEKLKIGVIVPHTGGRGGSEC